MRAPAGLSGVVVADTQIGGVRGEEGFFHYRQYSAAELAESCTFEEVWHLFDQGHLPTPTELKAFRQRIENARAFTPTQGSQIAAACQVGEGIPALTWVRTGLSIAAQGLGFDSWIGDLDNQQERLFNLAALCPGIVGLGWAARQAKAPGEHVQGDGVARGLLRAITNSDPSPQAVKAMETYLILTIDHGFNASTFAARSVVSTGADLGSGLVAGLASLSGPLHGGAPSHALEMLQEMGGVANVEPWVESQLGLKRRIMGFGHRVYKTADPRSEMLRRVVEDFDDPIARLAVAAEPIILEALQRHKPDQVIRTNVEFFAGVALHLAGVPAELFPACFGVSRTVGWSAHLLEQIADNRIVRPTSNYVGPTAPTPLDD